MNANQTKKTTGKKTTANKTANVKRHLWVDKSTAVVVAVKHPTVDNEADAEIHSFDSPIEAKQFAQDVGSMDDRSQMFVVSDDRLLEYGIEQKNINGMICLAKTANPFKIRVERIFKNAESLANMDSNSQQAIDAKLLELSNQIATLRQMQEAQAGNPDAVANAAHQEQLQQQIEADNESSRQGASDAADEEIEADSTTSSSRPKKVA